MFDFLPLGFSAGFAGEPPAAARAAAPRRAPVGLKTRLKAAGAAVPMVACTGSPAPPSSRLRLARAEAQALKSTLFLAGGQ